MITVADWQATAESIRTSPAGKLWGSPDMRPFRQNLESKLSEILNEKVTQGLGIQIKDYVELLQGQLTLAVTQDEWQGDDQGEPGWSVVLDVGDKQDQLRSRLEEVRKKLSDANQTVKTERIRDVEFSRIEIPGSDFDVDIFFGQSGSALLLGNSTTPLEKVLARLASSSLPNLSEDPNYQVSNQAWFRDAQAYGWINAVPVVQLLKKVLQNVMEDEEDMLPFEPASALRALGLEGLKGAAFAGQVNQEGSFFNLNLHVPETQRVGLFKLMQGDAKDSSPPAFVPADAAEFQRLRINGAKSWATIEETIRNLSPEMFGFFQMMTSMVGKEEDPGFDLKRSLFDNLGDDIISFNRAPVISTDGGEITAPTLVLIGSRNPDELMGAIFTLAGSLPLGLDTKNTREFNGKQIRKFSMPGLENIAPPVEFAAASGYLAISSTPSLLEEFLRSGEATTGRALRDDSAVRDAASRIGGMSTGLLGYQNQRVSTRVFWDFVRKGGVESLTGGISREAAAALDFKLLPEFDRVAQYFGIAVYTGSGDAQGLSLRFFGPTPK